MRRRLCASSRLELKLAQVLIVVRCGRGVCHRVTRSFQRPALGQHAVASTRLPMLPRIIARHAVAIPPRWLSSRCVSTRFIQCTPAGSTEAFYATNGAHRFAIGWSPECRLSSRQALIAASGPTTTSTRRERTKRRVLPSTCAETASRRDEGTRELGESCAYVSLAEEPGHVSRALRLAAGYRVPVQRASRRPQDGRSPEAGCAEGRVPVQLSQGARQLALRRPLWRRASTRASSTFRTAR
jgi:hypothetical protein